MAAAARYCRTLAVPEKRERGLDSVEVAREEENLGAGSVHEQCTRVQLGERRLLRVVVRECGSEGRRGRLCVPGRVWFFKATYLYYSHIGRASDSGDGRTAGQDTMDRGKSGYRCG